MKRREERNQEIENTRKLQDKRILKKRKKTLILEGEDRKLTLKTYQRNIKMFSLQGL